MLIKLKAKSRKQKAEWNTFRQYRPTRYLVGVGFVLLAFCFQLFSCTQSDPKYKQYYNQGEELYVTHCSNCHQKNGNGLGRLYPPIASSDYLKNNFNEVICLMRNGIDGSMVVNGKEFNQKMPGISTLTDLEVAEIATYIYNSWGNERGLVDVKEVTPILGQCAE